VQLGWKESGIIPPAGPVISSSAAGNDATFALDAAGETFCAVKVKLKGKDTGTLWKSPMVKFVIGPA